MSGIKKIRTLSNIGIFENFSWPTNPPDLEFKKVNLLYGFNGSGKTTISNIIDLLSEEHTEDIKKEIANQLASDNTKGISLDIEWDGGNIKSHLNSKKVYVFNSNFVSNHVYEGKQSKSLSFKGGIITMDHLANPTIKKLSDALAESKAKKKLAEEAIDKLKSETESIRKELSGRWNDSIAGHRMPTGLNIEQCINSSPVENEESLNKELIEQFKKFKVSKNQETLSSDISILNQTVLKKCTIPKDLKDLFLKSITQKTKDFIQEKIDAYKPFMIKHNSHQNWFEDGSLLLKQTKLDAICPLCDSKILDIEGIISKYDAYFNNELRAYAEQLHQVRTTLNGNIGLVQIAHHHLSRIKEILGKYECYDILLPEEKNVLEKVNFFVTTEHLEKLVGLVNSRGSDVSSKITESQKSLINAAVDDISSANEHIEILISLNGRLIQKLKSSLFDLGHAKNICGKLFWKSFDIRTKTVAEKYRTTNGIKFSGEQGGIEFYEYLKNNTGELDTQIKSNQKNIELELSKLRKESEYVNKFLEALCISNFYINIREKEDITITYRGKESNPKKGIKNSLSEGEKTALAFAYFLSKYKYEVIDNQDSNIKQEDYILVIDDPVSSLDENRLFSTALVIRQNLIPRWKKNDKQEVIWSGCKQIFITSHNLVFLKFLGNILDNEQNKVRGDFYLENACFNPLPEWFRNYQTSYFYKLSKLQEFVEKKISYESVKDHMPNYIRMVLEAFLAFKFARLRGKDKNMPPMLDGLISHLDSYDFSTYKAHNSIKDKKSLENILQEIKSKTNSESHGTVQDITHIEYLPESELRKLALQTIDVINYLDQLHYSTSSKLAV
jgi:wobble nucleotide-excising tRNase